MLNTVLTSNPSATSELAMAAVTGMATQFGGGRNVRIVSIDVKEVGEEFIAVATIQVEEPEAQETNDQKLHTQDDDERIIGSKADPDRFVVDPYYLNPQPSEAQRAFPDGDPQEAVPQNDTGEIPNADNPVQDDRSETSVGPETLTPQSEDLSEKLATDFTEAEAPAPAYNVDPVEIEEERLADKPLERMSPRELEELRAEVEERLKNMPPETVPPVENGVNPSPTT